MKKVLEGTLLSIAHRILQMKDKEDVNTLYKEAKEVYEKLAVLKFYNDNKPSLEGLISEETLEKQLAIVTSTSTQDDEGFSSVMVEREQMPTDLIQDDEDMKSVLVGYEEELLENTKGVILTNEEQLLEDTKGVLITKEEELLDDTKGTLISEKTADAENQRVHTDAVKIETIIENMEFDKQRLAYENQFIETPFVDSIEEEESDDMLHSYLDQHEAMLKQKADLVKEEDTVVDEELQEALIHPESAGLDQAQVRFEDSFLGFDFGDVDFVRVDDTINEASVLDETDFVPLVEKEDVLPTQSLFEFEPVTSSAPTKKSINDSFNNTISIGLNDRIGFEKHLFNGSSEDLNRVLSQLNTANSWEEAVAFIEDLVKPDYNYWEGKDEYVDRFMELAQKRFV